MNSSLFYSLLFSIITFTFLFPQTLKITSPQKGESWIAEESYDISWEADNISGKIVIEYKYEYESEWVQFKEVTIGEGNVSFYVQKFTDDFLYIRIRSLEDPSLSHETRIKITDCAGVPGGDATVDNCGTCDNYPYNDCVRDCEGTWGGSLVNDKCGVCGGDNSSCVNFTDEILPIFIDNCSGCHGGSGGLFLNTYENVMAGGGSGAVIEPGNHSNSYLWQRVDNGSMPPGGNPDLLTEQVNLIKQWINEGAQNN